MSILLFRTWKSQQEVQIENWKVIVIETSNLHQKWFNTDTICTTERVIRVEGQRKDAKICNYSPFSFRFVDKLGAGLGSLLGRFSSSTPRQGSKFWFFSC